MNERQSLPIPVRLLVALLYMLTLAGCAGAHPSAQLPTTTTSQGARTGLILAPARGAYHCAFPDFGGSEDNVSTRQVQRFESLVGKSIAWAYLSQNWYNGITFPAAAARAVHAAGSVPFIRMMPRSTLDENVAEHVFTLTRITRGDFDGDLIQWARDAKAVGFPIMVEFGTEVNGDWFPWNGSWYGNDPTSFRDAYRHIITLFRRQGADNITWAYHVDAQPEPVASWNTMAAYYPGDDYIDWIGLSVYGAMMPGDDWQSFQQVMDGAYAEFAALAPSKPHGVFEYGVTEGATPTAKATWIHDALESVRSGRYPLVKAMCYWNETWQNDDGSYSRLSVDSSATALAAYRAGIADPYFVSTIATDG